jgi:hypothetical protein
LLFVLGSFGFIIGVSCPSTPNATAVAAMQDEDDDDAASFPPTRLLHAHTRDQQIEAHADDTFCVIQDGTLLVKGGDVDSVALELGDCLGERAQMGAFSNLAASQMTMTACSRMDLVAPLIEKPWKKCWVPVGFGRRSKDMLQLVRRDRSRTSLGGSRVFSTLPLTTATEQVCECRMCCFLVALRVSAKAKTHPASFPLKILSHFAPIFWFLRTLGSPFSLFLPGHHCPNVTSTLRNDQS